MAVFEIHFQIRCQIKMLWRASLGGGGVLRYVASKGGGDESGELLAGMMGTISIPYPLRL